MGNFQNLMTQFWIKFKPNSISFVNIHVHVYIFISISKKTETLKDFENPEHKDFHKDFVKIYEKLTRMKEHKK